MSYPQILERLKPWRSLPFPLGLLSKAAWTEPEQAVPDRSDGRPILAASEASGSSGGKGPAPTDVVAEIATPGQTAADAMRGTTTREIHRKENRWPLLIREPDRRKSILANSAGLFDIADNPRADGATPWYSSHRDGYSGVKRHDARIEREAKRVGVDPNLMRALAYVEYANGYSYGGPAQWVGAAKSLYPMNIRPDRWAGLVGDADLNDSDVNVRAGALLLKRIAGRLVDPSVAKIATLYNNLARDEVSDYGQQVARAYRDKLWTAETLP